MKKQKVKEKVIFNGRGDCLLTTIAPNGEGLFDVTIENDTDILLIASNLAGKKDCELTAALYLLIKNGHASDIYVHGGKKKDAVIVKKQPEIVADWDIKLDEPIYDGAEQTVRDIVQAALDGIRNSREKLNRPKTKEQEENLKHNMEVLANRQKVR